MKEISIIACLCLYILIPFLQPEIPTLIVKKSVHFWHMTVTHLTERSMELATICTIKLLVHQTHECSAFCVSRVCFEIWMKSDRDTCSCLCQFNSRIHWIFLILVDCILLDPWIRYDIISEYLKHSISCLIEPWKNFYYFSLLV